MGVCDAGEKKPRKNTKTINATEFKTYIMAAQAKIDIYRQRKINAISQKRKELVLLLRSNNIEVAKAKMESLMRDEDLITAYDILGPMFEVLKEKVTYILSATMCPVDLRIQTDSIVYAAFRLEVEELLKLKEIFRIKFGDNYITSAYANEFGKVNPNLVNKLTVKPFPNSLIIVRLKQFASECRIEVNFPMEVDDNEGNDGNMGYNNNRGPDGYDNYNNFNNGPSPNNQYNDMQYNDNQYNPPQNNPYDNINQQPNPYDNNQMEQNNNNPYNQGGEFGGFGGGFDQYKNNMENNNNYVPPNEEINNQNNNYDMNNQGNNNFDMNNQGNNNFNQNQPGPGNQGDDLGFP